MKKILTLFTALLLFGSMVVQADDIYVVAGSSAALFGETWNGALASNKMTWDAGRSSYVKEYTVTAAESAVELKVVKNSSEWNGDFLGNNVKFDLSGAGSFTVLFNTTTGVASVEGAIVIPQSMYSVYAAGNGNGNWLHGANWDAGNSDNKMTEVEPNVWEITFNDVAAATGQELKFTVNGAWDVNFGGTFSAFDAVTETALDGSNITFDSPGGTDISARLDLRNCKSGDKTGGKFTVSAGSLPELHSCYVAGSSAEIFGTAWAAELAANKMILAGSEYSKTYTVAKAYKSVSLKAVYDGAWFGDNGENVKFSLSGAGDFTVKFDKFTHEVTVEGAIVGPEQFDFDYVTIAGNGSEGNSWVSGEDWATTAAINRMTEVSPNVYEISFDNVNGTECKFKFSFNGGWEYQMSGVFSSFGTVTAAVYNKNEEISFTPAAGADITIRLDLSNFNFATKTGATFTVDQEPDAFVAGSEAEIFGTAWTAGLSANQMTWNEGLSKYAKVYTVDKAYKSVGLKVVYGNEWYGENGGSENVKFSLSGPGEFVVYFNKATYHVTVAGPIVGEEQFDFEYAAVAANGEGNWAHGEDWNAATTTNRMTEVTANVWEISFENVAAKDCQLKFCFDGTWDHEFGGTFSAFGTASQAVYGNSASSINFSSTAGSIITVRLNLSNFNFATKEGATFTVSQVEPISPIGGKFIINAKGDTAVFSRGNLQYKQSSDKWRCAPNQYDWAGEAANEQMGNSAYTGWVDLFSWSLGAENNYGATSAYLSTAYHNKNFVDWGGLFSGDWSTLSSAQWQYLLNTRSDANDKWGMAMIEDNLGMILLPDEWETPAGITFVPRTNPTSELWDDDDMIDDTEDHYRVKPENMPANKFTLAEWAQLEASGAIFLPYAGRRSGGYGNHINKDDQEVVEEVNYTYFENYLGTYWTSTPATKANGTANYVYTFKHNGGNDYQWGKAVIWSENGRYGQSVRLVHIIPRQYTVTYDAGGAEGDVPVDEQTYLNGAEITLAAATGLSKDGYKFAGWKFKGTTYNGSYTVNNVLANEQIVFEAQWEIDWQTVRSGLEAGRHYTVCLPKNITAIKGATFWSLAYKNASSTVAYLVQETAPEAGKPYIFQATGDNEGKLEVVYGNETAGAPVENGALRGTFSYMSGADLEGVAGTVYMLFQNELRPIGTNNHLDANRAYVRYDLLDVAPSPNFAPGKNVKAMPLHGDAATGMDQITNDPSAITNKVIIDGRLYILRGEKLYDATGRLVK